MSSENEAAVSEVKWGHFSLWIVDSFPPGTMAVLQELRIVSSSDAQSIPTTIEADALGRFTLKLTLSPSQPDMALVCKGVVFTVPTDPV
jgi:hypothetical protein